MDIRKLSEDFAVGAQITPDDVRRIKEAGYRSIISNRPDGEAPDQTDFAAIREEAARQGLKAEHVPVISGQLKPEDVTRFGQAMDELPGPVFAYCRSGTRSATLWSLDRAARGEPREEIVEAAARAGYNVAPVLGG